MSQPAGSGRLQDRVQQFLLLAGQRQDLIIVAFLVTAIIMMVLPLPTWLVDFLLAGSMSVTVLLLMVSLYLKSPLDFSTLPAVILISTVFRLALSITTTRLILLQADAGAIIQTFGSFVVAGNLVVGLVIFLIITVVQFVVITKGAERIAEVSARFTLDALPGKQMSIDADLRSGDVDQSEARRRRTMLEKESQLYGAMDGTMKFVKGDAIAGLVIIAVNLLGGITVGTMQQDMTVGEALQVYALLTVGDGLVAQIPALFLSITAGTFVTRVTSENSENLGSDISRQLVSDPRSLGLAAFVVLIMAAVPGFPSGIFLFLAAMLGGLSALFYRRARLDAAEAPEPRPRQPGGGEPRSEPSQVVVVRAGAALYPALEVGLFQRNLRRIRESIFSELGVQVPSIWFEADPVLPPNSYGIDIEGVPVTDGELKPEPLLLYDDPAHLELLDIAGETGGPLLDLEQTVWLDPRHRQALERAGVGFMDCNTILATIIGKTLSRHAARFLGIQETQIMLQRMNETHGDLIREMQRGVPLQKTADVLRRLLDEGVSIRNLRAVLEALVEWGGKEQDPVLLAEYVRTSLGRQICHSHADANKVLAAVIFEKEAEDLIRGAIRQTSVGSFLALDERSTEALIGALRRSIERKAGERAKLIVLTSLDVRRYVRSLLQKNGFDLAVLSYQDLVAEFSVQPIGTIRLPTAEAAKAAAPKTPAQASA